MFHKTTNIFTALLSLLKVKFTDEYSNRVFNEHPHKYNLFGLSSLLSDYNIENEAYTINDKEKDINKLPTPFIAHLGSDFVIVKKIDNKHVTYMWNEIIINLDITEFCKSWSGVVLLVDISEKSIEPNYRKHRNIERLNLGRSVMFFAAVGLILFWAYLSRSLYANVSISILLLINLIGVYIGYLLLLKQMHIQSRYSDKICSLFKQHDCNNVLETQAAKLWGIFGWSEIGLGYFVTNVLILLFLPQAVSFLAIINIFTLPYAFWSVWYQKTKARQWCMLCLIVQVLLWTLFCANVLLGYILMPEINFHNLFDMVLLGSCYAAAILGVNMLVPKFNAKRALPFLWQIINAMKADEDVFRALLKQQPYYEVSDVDSQICFGNPDGTLQLTILTNPYCNPCAAMHKRIVKLLQKNNNISVKYIFSSFYESLNAINQYLIAAYLQKELSEFEQIIAEWFETGKMMSEKFFENMRLDIILSEVENEFLSHEAWKERTQLCATPTVLVNGYKLPENYRVEDLEYFTEFNVKN